VHIARDPRDVAASNIGMGWAGNVWYGVDRWTDLERRWHELRATLPSGSWLEVRMEDLICEPEGVLTAICGFIGVPFDPVMLEYPKHTTYAAPDRTLVEQWRRKLRPREIALVECKVGPLLGQAGYAASGVPTRPPSALERGWLALDDLLQRHRFRIQRMGVRLWGEDLLSRYLGIVAWQRRLEPRRRAVWKAGLK
jgi:hypothetical protein